MIYITADPHYGHKNIIRPDYCNRPWDTIQEHDDGLIQNWNARVTNRDTVFLVGDFSWRRTTETLEILERLNGNIALIRGNHDKTLAKRARDRFSWVKDYYKFNIKSYIPEEDQSIILFHYGMRVWDGSHRGAWHLYGHSHGSLPPHGLSFDIGVDNNNYEPLSYWAIKAKMKLVQEKHEEEGKDYMKLDYHKNRE